MSGAPSTPIRAATLPMKGEVVYLYAFDVANEIATAQVQEILSRKPVPFAVRTDRALPKSVPLYRPLAIEPALTVPMGGRPVRMLVRVYDVGVITVALRMAVEADGIGELLPLHQPAFDNGQTFAEEATAVCAEVVRELRDLMRGQSPPTEPEAYTVFCLTDLGGETDACRWLEANKQAVAGLLAESPGDRLSDDQVSETLRLRRSFERGDLVVIDWDAALVVDLSGYYDDVLYVLELANLQLVEFRVIDQILDRYLDRAYDDLERRPRTWLGRPPGVLPKLRYFRVDVTKLADEVTHITKFFGDWYLARIYLAARERFALDRWRTSVEGRLAQLDQLYNVFHSEVYERRMLWLEAIIVVLFVIDLVALFLGRQ
jgi:hypothetical protein